MRLSQSSACIIAFVSVVAIACGGSDETNSGNAKKDSGTDSGAGGSSDSGTGGATGGTGGGAATGGTAGGAATGGAAGGAATGGAAGLGGGAGAGGAAGAAAAGGTGGAFDPTCYGCHGTVGSPTPAPPKSTTGQTATSDTGVGAHQSHLGASVWHAEVFCDACHTVPTAIGDVGHIDTSLPAEVQWDPGDLGNADGASPAWGGTTCSGVYCHGATLMGAANKTPNWTTVDGSQEACGTACHGTPPSGAHPSSYQCDNCHGGVIASFTPTVVWTDASKHINGKVDF